MNVPVPPPVMISHGRSAARNAARASFALRAAVSIAARRSGTPRRCCALPAYACKPMNVKRGHATMAQDLANFPAVEGVHEPWPPMQIRGDR